MVEGVSEVSFIRVPTLFMRVLPSWYNQFPKTLFPNIITLGIRSPSMNFGGEGTQTFSLLRFSSVQSLSQVWLFAIPWTAGFPGHHQLPELTQTHVHRISDAIQPSHPLLSPSPPAFNLSQHQGLFQWVGSSHQVTKVLDFRFSISPSIENSGLISFRIDRLNLLAVQGILKSLLQHHSSKASVF